MSKSQNNDLLQMLTRGASSASQYQDLVNQPGFMDPFADQLIEQGRAPALNAKQRNANALVGGFGAGVKGAANQARQSKLAQLEKAAYQVAMQDAQLKVSAGKFAQNKQDLANYTQNNDLIIQSLNQAAGKNDEKGMNEMLHEFLIPNAENDLPGFKEKYGKFTHMKNYVMYFNKDGKNQGVDLRDFMSQLPIEPGKVKNLLNPYASRDFERSDLLEDLKVQGAQSQISNVRSQTNLHDAQADKLRYEISPEGRDATSKAKEHGSVSDEEVIGILDSAGKTIDDVGEKASRGRTGRIVADWVPGGSPLTPEEAQIDTLGKVLKGKLFRAYGYRNETEFEAIPHISINNTPEANKAIVGQLKNLYLKSKGGANTQTNEIIQMKNIETGQTLNVPKEKESLFRQNGYQ